MLEPGAAAEYRALREGAGLLERPTRARIRVAGRNRLDLLHRMTSQELRTLRAGEGRTAVLLNDKGRIVDHLAVFALDEELRILSAREDAAPSLAHLKRYTLRDDFRPEHATNSTVLLQVLGPRAEEALRAAGVDAPALARPAGRGLEPAAPARPEARGPRASEVGRTGPGGGGSAPALEIHPLGGEEFLLRIDGPCALNLALWVPAERAPEWRRRLLEGGGGAGLASAYPGTGGPASAGPTIAGTRIVGAQAYEAVRVEAGFPAWGSELNEEMNPLEAGLDASIHWNKGCYIGQEVIARLDTYHKVQRHLVGLRFDTASAPPAARAQVFASGEAAGWVTSSIVSPALGVPIALAYVRASHAAPGTAVQVGSPAGGGAGASVVPLPFVR